MNKEDFLHYLLNSYYKLREGYTFFFPLPNEMHIRMNHLGESLVSLKNTEGEMWASDFFGGLDGTKTIAELIGVVPEVRQEDVLRVIAALRRDFLVESQEKIESGDESKRWLRHLMDTRRSARAYYETSLADARVTVIGAGSLGSRIATGLVQLGIGEITVTDCRKVSREDRMQSPAYVQAAEGQARADALAKFLDCLSQGKNVRALELATYDRQELERLMEGQSLVVLAEDAYRPDLYQIVNEAAAKAGIRWTTVLIDGWDVYVGPTILPGATGCHACFHTHRRREKKLGASFDRYAEYLAEGGEAPVHIHPAFADVAAGMLVSDLPNLIGQMPAMIEEESSLTLGRELHLKMRTFDASLQRVAKEPRCPVCGPKQAVSTQRQEEV